LGGREGGRVQGELEWWGSRVGTISSIIPSGFGVLIPKREGGRWRG